MEAFAQETSLGRAFLAVEGGVPTIWRPVYQVDSATSLPEHEAKTSAMQSRGGSLAGHVGKPIGGFVHGERLSLLESET